MPTAPKLDWPQGQPLFEVQWRAVAESLAGNGVVGTTDLDVTATATDLEIQVAAGTVFYLATEYSIGAAETHTLSAGDGTNDRWDTVYFDTATSSSGVREGTPAADPEPPDIQGGELLLAIVYVPQNASDVPGSDVLNWRAQFSNEAEEVHYDDSAGVYGVSNVDAALDTLQYAAQLTGYPLPLDTDTDLDVGTTDLTASDGATVLYESSNTWFRNEVVQGLANFTGDEQFTSYPLPIGDLASPYSLPAITDMDAAGNDLVDGGTTVWDTSAGWVPRPQVDDQRALATITTSTHTTSDEEVLLVDTATIGATSTITLASADATAGNVISVVDLSGSAATYPITIDTEGGETIDSAASKTIDQDYSALILVSDGTNWTTLSNAFSGVDVEDSTVSVLAAATGINFGTALDVSDDGDSTVTVDANVAGKTNLATGTFNHTTGGPTTHTATNVTTTETENLHVEVGVDTGTAAAYSWDYTWDYSWDDTNGELDVVIEATWGTDPGSDITLDYEVYILDDVATQGVGTEDGGTSVVNPARNINFGSGLSVADDGDETVTVDASSSSGGTNATKWQPTDGHDVNITGTLSFDSVVFDEISGVSVDTTNDVVDITEAGTYEIGFGIYLTTPGSESGTRQQPTLWFEKNGGIVPGSKAAHTYIRHNGSHTTSSANATTVVELVNGDSLTVAHQVEAAGTDTIAADKAASALYIKKLS